MAKPIGGVLTQIYALPRTSHDRLPELTHMTLLTFFDLATSPAHWLPTVKRLMDAFHAYAFHVWLNRIEERDAVTLRSTVPLRAARAFQRQLAAYLRRCGFTHFCNPPRAHVTLNYHRDEKGGEIIDPIGWRIDEIVLIESIHGKATHELHGRWQLQSLLI
jgi:2'-5' RNA ligase